MHTFLVLGVVLGVALADANGGYQYKAPQNSYGLPSLQAGSGSNSFNTGFYPGLNSNQGQFGHSSGPSFTSSQSFESFGTSGLGSSLGSNLGSNFGSAGSNFGSLPSNFGSSGSSFGSTGSNFGSSSSNLGLTPSYFGPSGSNFGSTGSNFGSLSSNFGSVPSNFGLSGSNFGSSGSNFGSSDFGTSGFGSSFGNGGLGSSFFESGTIQPSISGSQFGSSNSFQSTSQNKHQGNYKYVTQPAQVFKHFYVHAAPEEPESARPRQPIVLPPPQKHYKIIFIKAPSQNYAPPVIPVQQQNEEKTIVYVLVNKQEDAQNIVLPKFDSKPPTKPEVFFIKYNNKEGSQAVINNIVNDYNKGGATVNYNAGEQQAIVTGGGNFNFGTSGSGSSDISSAGIGPSGIGSIDFSGGATNGFESSSISGGSYGVTTKPIVTISTVDNGSSAGGDFTIGSTVSPVNNAVTGSFSETSSHSSDSFDNSNLVSTSQGVPHESYGTPKFRE